MKTWHKLQNGTYFVDVLLFIAALIAIIGLATFVRLHTAKSPGNAGKRGTITMSPEHLDTLSLDNGGSGTPTPSGSGPHPQAVGPASSSASSQLQSAMTAPEASSPASACAKNCDSTNFTVPKTDDSLAPIKVQPIIDPVKTCNGLINQAVNSLSKSGTDHIECPLY